MNIHQPLPCSQTVNGYLRLGFVYDQALQQTKLATCEQRPPLKVVRAFPLVGGEALVHLHNLSGGVLGGDRLELSVEVGPQALVQLTSTSATRIYRSRPEVPLAQQTNKIQIKEGGLLEYLPDQLIPFAGSRYRQRTQIELSTDAGLFWWETIAPGRLARGELFDYDLLDIGLDISTRDRPLAIERIKLEPHCRPLTSPVRLGAYQYFSTFYICRLGLENSRWLSLERELSELAMRLSHPGEIVWSVSPLVAHGLVVRALSRQGSDITAGLLSFWRATKLALYGREAIPPRKIY